MAPTPSLGLWSLLHRFFLRFPSVAGPNGYRCSACDWVPLQSTNLHRSGVGYQSTYYRTNVFLCLSTRSLAPRNRDNRNEMGSVLGCDSSSIISNLVATYHGQPGLWVGKWGLLDGSSPCIVATSRSSKVETTELQRPLTTVPTLVWMHHFKSRGVRQHVMLELDSVQPPSTPAVTQPGNKVPRTIPQ